MEPNFNDEIPFETALPCASDSVPAPISPDDEIDGYPVELLQAYIKNNSDIYIERFRALSEGKITFHWPAFFFQPMWYFYRGLYNWGLITLLIYLVAPIITFPIIFFITLGVSHFMPYILDDPLPFLFFLAFISEIIVNLPFTLLANKLYFQGVKRQIDRIRAEAAEAGQDLRTALRKEKVTDSGSVGIYILLNIFLLQPLQTLLLRGALYVCFLIVLSLA